MRRKSWLRFYLGTANEAVNFTKFESEAMTRRYYPFFFRILNEKGEVFYSSKEFERYWIRFQRQSIGQCDERQGDPGGYLFSRKEEKIQNDQHPSIRKGS